MAKDDRKELTKLLVKATKPISKKGMKCEPEYVLSGGTNSGISKVAAEFGEQTGVPVHGWLPTNAQPAKGVKPHHHKPKDEFSVKQPLAMWKYLGERGAIGRGSLVVVATSGGPIASAELAIAAACDVPIALLPFGDPETTEAAVRLFRPEKRQLVIPNDAMALRAFLLRSWGVIELPPDPESDSLDSALKEAAVQVHKDYRAKQSARKEDPEPAAETWRKLKKDLKKSNLDQAATHVHYLREAGITVHGSRIDGKAAKQMRAKLEEDSKLKERLSELEHGRWMVERFELGIKRGPRPYRGDPPDHSTLWVRIKAFFAGLANNLFHDGKKVEERTEIKDRTHSDVVAWRDLPREVRDQDRDAIEGIPEIYDHPLP